MLSYRLPKWAMRNYLLTGSLVVVLCGSIGVVEFRRYFIYWARDPKVDEAFARSYADTAESLNQLPNDQIKRVVIELDNEQVNSDFWSAWTIMFLTDTAKPEKQAGRNIYYVRPDDNIEVDCTYKVFIQPSY